MKRALLNMAGGCAAALLLLGTTALSANANYLGYGNGDPGNWDLWTEQAGGPPPAAAHPRHSRHAHLHHAQRHAQHVHHQHQTGKSQKHS